MARWTIYDKNGNVKAITSGITVGSRTLPELEYSGTWMGETFVTISVKSEQPVNWQIGDYLIYRGEKFVLNYDPSVVKKARRNTYGDGFVYDSVKFNSLNVEMSDVQFLDEVLSDNHIHYTSLPIFSFFAATIDDYADRLQANMNRYCLQNNFVLSEWWLILTPSRTRTVARGAGISGLSARLGTAWDAAYHDEPSTDGEKFNQNVSINNSTVFTGLANIYNLFGLHFVTSGRTLIIGAAGKIASHVFEYGKGNGLYEIERVVDSEQQIITKLYAYGNSTNLPIRYYAQVNKTCFATITSIETYGGSFKLDIPFKAEMFNGEQNPAVALISRKVTFTAGGNSYTCYCSSDETYPVEVHNGNCYLNTFQDDNPNLSVGTVITFTAGIVEDKWPAGHYSYVNDDSVLPDNLAVNNLMLPGFPTQSLKAWVLANGGTLNQDGTVTWNGHTAFFSTNELAPYILSTNSAALGVREASKTCDGSDDTEDIYPTIENTGKDILVSADIITDNGVFGEGEEVPNFSVIVKGLGNNVELDSLISNSGGAAKISMKDGYCGGREFSVLSAEKVAGSNNWKLTLQRDYDEALQLYFPYSNNASIGHTPVANEAYQLRGSDIVGYDGDKFVWLGIDMPSEFIEASAEKLLDAALTFLEANDYARYTYSPKVDEIFMAKQHDAAIASQHTPNPFDSLHDTLHEGNLMQFDDEDLLIDGNVFIDKLTIKEYSDKEIPTYDVTLRNHKSVGTYQRLLNTVDSLSGKGGSGGSGVSTSQAKDLIKREGDKRYIRRDINDEAQGKITFRRGADFADNAQGQFTPDAVGAGIWQDENKNWHIESDFLHARKKLTAKEVQIEDVSHIGGQQLLTAAGMHADFVVEKENAYRCFFLKVDSNGREVRNKWAIGDQAYVCTFNLKVTDTHSGGEGDKVGNHYLWRLVTGVSGLNNTDTNTYVVDGTTYDASEYHFIDLSKSDCDSDSDAPWSGDDIVQLGNRNDSDRQNAIILAGAGSASPYIRQFVGINSFTLPSPDTQIKPNDNLFTGRVKMQAGSEIDPSVVQVGATNLLLNTGFRGQHNSRNLDANTQTSEEFELWSPSLEGWNAVNAEAIEDADSASGKACVINNGTLSQNLVKPMLANADYFLTLKGKGESVTIQIGEQEENISLTNDYFVHHVALKPDANISELSISGTATICELFLEKSNIYSTTWSPSPLDADEALDKFNSIKYLTDAMKNASTTVLGGLILSNLIELGNYLNGEMQEVTAGVSGVYNNDNDIAFWGGGTLEKAIRAVNLFRQDPTYQPKPEEWASVANAVITHGGRAILNDAIFRGSVYAENGYFKGELRAARGTFDGYVKENFIKVADSDAEYDSTNNYYVLKDNINLELPSILGTSTLPKSYVYLPSDVKYIGTHARFYNDRSGLTTRIPFADPELICENGFLGITFISDESTLTDTLPTRMEFRGGVIELIGVPSVYNGQNCCAWVVANALCTELNAYANSTPILKTEVYGGTTVTVGNSVYQIKADDTSITPTPCAITMTPSYISGEVNGHEMSFGNTGGFHLIHSGDSQGRRASIEFVFDDDNGVYKPHIYFKNSDQSSPHIVL